MPDDDDSSSSSANTAELIGKSKKIVSRKKKKTTSTSSTTKKTTKGKLTRNSDKGKGNVGRGVAKTKGKKTKGTKRKISLPDTESDDSSSDDGKGGGEDLFDDSDSDDEKSKNANLFDNSESDDDDSDNDKDGGNKSAGKGNDAVTNGGGGDDGLFDSSEDEDDESEDNAEKTRRKKPVKKRPLSKREKLEAMARKRASSHKDDVGKKSRRDKESGNDGNNNTAGDNDKGYESQDSFNSVDFKRTKEDDDFIDASGEDPDAVAELYAEQHFEDEAPDDMDSDEDDEDGGRRRKVKGRAKPKKKSSDVLSSDDELDEDGIAVNPVVAAVRAMKKKKIKVVKVDDLRVSIQDFISKMEDAADADAVSLRKRSPGVARLRMLDETIIFLGKRENWKFLLEEGVLKSCGRWVRPLPNGSLGNVTLRRGVIKAIAGMTGEQGINSEDLKKSQFGRILMSLYMHRSETPEMKRMHKILIEKWSRPIFKKSGDMSDFGKCSSNRRGSEYSLAGIARNREKQKRDADADAAASPGIIDGDKNGDGDNIFSKSSKTSPRDLGNNRVRVPYSKGFQYTVTPKEVMRLSGGAGIDNKTRNSYRGGPGDDRMSILSRKMKERQKPGKKNQRSCNLSTQGK